VGWERVVIDCRAYNLSISIIGSQYPRGFADEGETNIPMQKEGVFFHIISKQMTRSSAMYDTLSKNLTNESGV
jgi:hypothetical protein